jgi:hypothetical protein
MGMDPIHSLPWLAEAGDKLISQLLKMGPKQFFAEITLGSKRKAENPRPWANLFLRTRVIGRYTPINDLPRDNIDSIDLGTQSQTSRQFKDVERLTACIGIATKL